MTVVATQFLGGQLTDKQEALLEATVIGVVAVVSGYVGAKIQQKRDRDNGD